MRRVRSPLDPVAVAIERCLQQRSRIHLSPTDDLPIQNGVITLVVVHEEKELPFKGMEKRLPTLDLRRVGIEPDSSTSRTIHLQVQQYLKDAEFTIALRQPFDIEFCWQALAVDPLYGIMALALINATSLRAELPFSSPVTGSEMRSVEGRVYEFVEKTAVEFDIHINKTLIGLDLSKPVRLSRGQLLNLLAPKGSAEREVIQTGTNYLTTRAGVNMRSEALKKCYRRYWWLPRKFFWIQRMGLRRCMEDLLTLRQQLRRDRAAMGMT